MWAVSGRLWKRPRLMACFSSATYQFELAVIGGGSGGIACAKEAGDLLGPGKVVLFDLVKPTPIGECSRGGWRAGAHFSFFFLSFARR